MAATKFSEAEREKLFAQLEAPFDPALVKWRVMRENEIDAVAPAILSAARAFLGGG